ncbi:MAG: tetratricopeptide repeat protein, partial [Polyangiaceae bacterium]
PRARARARAQGGVMTIPISRRVVPSRRIAARIARRLLALAALGLAMGLASPASASTSLDDANRAFALGHYDEAAAQDEALLARRGYSAPVLFDLGNAYLRAGKPVDAVLAYERARLLSPRDAAIADNLAAARKAAGLAADGGQGGLGGLGGLVERVDHRLSAGEWTWLAFGAFWLALAAGGGALLFRRPRGWLLGAACAGTLVAAIGAAGLVVSSRDLHAGLAMHAAPVLVSPFPSAQSSFALPAGTAVELGRVHDGYVLVRDRAGQSGWVEQAAVAPLVPD